jgi:hypothetical protein
MYLTSSNKESHLAESKRYFTTQDFTFHLMRKHFWPSMEYKTWELQGEKKQKYISSLLQNKSSYSNNLTSSSILDSSTQNPTQNPIQNRIQAMGFVGYKQGKKLGPGVIYFVRENRQIDTHLGAYVDDMLDNEATIFRNGKLVFDGAICKGIKEGFATQRFYFEIDDEEGVLEKKDRVCYIEYKGHFVNNMRNGEGEVHFYGNLAIFAEYFEKLKEMEQKQKEEEENSDSEDYGIPLGNPVITNHVDPKYDINKIFSRIPVVPVESEDEETKEKELDTGNSGIWN